MRGSRAALQEVFFLFFSFLIVYILRLSRYFPLFLSAFGIIFNSLPDFPPLLSPFERCGCGQAGAFCFEFLTIVALIFLLTPTRAFSMFFWSWDSLLWFGIPCLTFDLISPISCQGLDRSLFFLPVKMDFFPMQLP